MAQPLCSCGSISSPLKSTRSRERLSRARVVQRSAARSAGNRDQSISRGPAQPFAVLKTAAAGLLLSAGVLLAPPALADLNQFEANIGGEFNIGTAKQYGEAEVIDEKFSGHFRLPSRISGRLTAPCFQLNNKDFHGEDLRRSNFTSASCKSCNFKNAKLQGTYFIKAVVAKANFEVWCSHAD